MYDLILEASEIAGVEITGAETSQSLEGPWFGNGSFRNIEKPEVLMIIGDGVSSSSAGTLWHMTDTKLDMPVTKVDISRFGRVNLSDYNTIILPSGGYNTLSERELSSLNSWVSSGGRIIAVGSAINWLNSKKIVDLEIGSRQSASDERLNYNKSRLESGKHSIGGIFCKTDLDITHPLGFGYNDRSLTVYRNHTSFVSQVDNNTSNVAVYTNDPVISGFITPENTEKLRNTSSLITLNKGRGKLILFIDDPVFRGCWYGTNKLLINAIFLGSGI